MEQQQRIGRATLFIYALPGFALAMPTIPAYVYLPTFYAETLGQGLGALERAGAGPACDEMSALTDEVLAAIG